MKKDNIYSDTTVKCSICGETETLHWNLQTNKECTEHRMCFNCNFWRDHYENNLNRSLRIKGKHYMASGESDAPAMFRGFGGTGFTIKKFDGTVIKTTNLWHQGDIPEYWKDKLPDNAKFVSRNI